MNKYLRNAALAAMGPAVLLGSTAMAQQNSLLLPRGPGPAPGHEDRIATPAFDCGDPKPQVIGDHETLQIVHSPFMREVPGHGSVNICPLPNLPCMIFTRPSGRVFVRTAHTEVLEGEALDNAQSAQIYKLGFTMILKCKAALEKK